MFFPLFDGHNKRRLLLLWAEFWLKIRPEFLKNSAATYYSDKIPNWEVKKAKMPYRCHFLVFINSSSQRSKRQRNPWRIPKKSMAIWNFCSEFSKNSIKQFVSANVFQTKNGLSEHYCIRIHQAWDTYKELKFSILSMNLIKK